MIKLKEGRPIDKKFSPTFMLLRTKNSKLKTQRGFTLIEILVVVAIIGILASIILVGVGSFRARGRDARRVADLRETQNGLELYFTKNGYYPDVNSWSALTTDLIGGLIGVNAVPNDPTSGWNYAYCRSGTDQYVEAAYMEDIGNPQLKQYPAGTTFPCTPTLLGTPADPSCSTASAITNKYCLIF